MKGPSVSNVIEFKKKDEEPPSSTDVLTLTMYQNTDGQFEMYMEINEEFSNYEVYIALEAAACKFGIENKFIEMDYSDVSDKDNTDD